MTTILPGATPRRFRRRRGPPPRFQAGPCGHPCPWARGACPPRWSLPGPRRPTSRRRAAPREDSPRVLGSRRKRHLRERPRVLPPRGGPELRHSRWGGGDPQPRCNHRACHHRLGPRRPWKPLAVVPSSLLPLLVPPAEGGIHGTTRRGPGATITSPPGCSRTPWSTTRACRAAARRPGSGPRSEPDSEILARPRQCRPHYRNHGARAPCTHLLSSKCGAKIKIVKRKGLVRFFFF